MRSMTAKTVESVPLPVRATPLAVVTHLQARWEWEQKRKMAPRLS